MSGYVIEVATVGGIMAIASYGLYVTMLSGQWSIAHAAFMGIGAYTSAVVTRDIGLPFVAAVLAGCLVAGVTGALLSAITARLSDLFLAIITVVFGQAMVVLVRGLPQLGGSLGFYPISREVSPWMVFLALAAVIVGVRFLQLSRWGYAAQAVREDQLVAGAVGIPVASVRIWFFALGSAIAGFAGALLAHHSTLIEPSSLGFAASFQLFVIVVVGGSTAWPGPLVGATIATLGPELARVGTSLRPVFFGVLLLVIVIIRPYGLVPRRPARIPMGDAPVISNQSLFEGKLSDDLRRPGSE